MAKLVSTLIESVQERAALPANNDRFTDDDIKDLLKEELEETVVPFMTSLVEEFFVYTKDVAMQDANSAAKYPDLLIPLPKRAFGRGLRDLQYIDSSDNRHNIPFVAPEDKDRFHGAAVANYSAPEGFYFQNDSVKLIGASTNLTGSLEFSYYLKVPTLVDSDNLLAPVTTITWDSVNEEAEITADTTSTTSGEGFTLSGTGLYDLFNRTTGTYVALDLKATITGSGSSTVFTTLNLDEDDVTQIKQNQEGGYPVAAPYSSDLVLVPQEMNPYTPIPIELDNLLVLATCSRILESLGDSEGLQISRALMESTKKTLAGVYENRIVGESRKVVNRRGIYNFARTRFVKGRF